MTSRLIVAALGGAFSWTFLEYVMHRWLGHDPRLRGNPFGVEHVRHHVEGDYFAPAWKKLLAATGFVMLLGAPALVLFGVVGLTYVGSLIGAYGVYEVLHRLDHVWAGLGPYGRWARRHHFAHHFVDARLNHGVTSPLWDLVFGTYHRPGKIIVPRKLCMSWLRDPATGDIRGKWADSYMLAPDRNDRDTRNDRSDRNDRERSTA